MVIGFVVPDPGGVLSGGHLYNQHLRAALCEQGVDAPRLGLGEFRRLAVAASPGVFLVDTLYLDQLADLPIERVRAYVLVHHLESMAPPAGSDAEQLFAIEAKRIARFAGCVATSSFTADYLDRPGLEGLERHVVCPAVEGLAVAPMPGSSRESVHPYGVFALLVANLVERKGILPFLQSLAARPIPGLQVRVLGGAGLEPGYAAACHALVASEPSLMSSVHLVGEIDHREMAVEYQAADVFVSVASMETFGMALQESVAAGVPVFALDRGHVGSHVVEGVSGRLFDSVAALVSGLRAFSSNAAERSALRQGARDTQPLGERSWVAAAKSLRHALAV